MKLNLIIKPLLILFSFTVLIACGNTKSKHPIATFSVEAVTNKDYRIKGGNLTEKKNPTLILKRGETYEFVIKSFGHPFYIKTEKVSGKDKTYDKGLTKNGIDEGTILFRVPTDAPNLLYYVCKYHKMMSGEIKVVD